MKLVLSRLALAELDAILAYIAERSPLGAEARRGASPAPSLTSHDIRKPQSRSSSVRVCGAYRSRAILMSSITRLVRKRSQFCASCMVPAGCLGSVTVRSDVVPRGAGRERLRGCAARGWRRLPRTACGCLTPGRPEPPRDPGVSLPGDRPHRRVTACAATAESSH